MPQPTVQNELFTRLTNCAKTPAQWANTAGTPMLGEPCWEIQEAQTASGLPYSFRLKIGDGTTSYANLPYYGDFVTLHTDNNTALSVAAWDGTNSQLNFYKVTETNGIVALEQNPYLRLKAGDKVTISTSTVGGVNVLQINHAEQEQGDVTEDSAELTDGGTFKVATGKDEYGHINEWTTFTLPSIATAIANAIDGLDSSVASTGNVYVLKSITETNGKLTAKTETQIVGGTNMSVVGTDDAITINHDPIDQTAQDAASGITSDHSSPSGERNMDIITGFKVDAQGHVIHIDKDSSMNLIAADIKAPVKRQDDSTWNYRETGGDITIGEDTARIPVLKGKTMVWNQLVPNSNINFTNSSTDTRDFFAAVIQEFNGTTPISQIFDNNYSSATVYSGIIQLDSNANTLILKHNGAFADLPMWNITGVVGGHKYYVHFDAKSTNPSTVGGLIVDNNNLIDLTKLFGSDFNIEKALLGLTTEVAWDNLTADQLVLAATNFEKLFPNSYYPYCEGRLVNLGGYGVKMNQILQEIHYTITLTAGGYSNLSEDVAYKSGHKYYMSKSQTFSSTSVYIQSEGLAGWCVLGGSQKSSIFTASSDFTGKPFWGNDSEDAVSIDSYVNLIDLTEMFGSGSEPTLEECEQIFTQDYYEYNTGYDCNILDVANKKLELLSTDSTPSTGAFPDESDENTVDMGLPSGLLWARSNVDVTQKSGFAASPYQYEATFFSWGNVKGQNPNSSNAFDESWGSASDGEPYVSTPGAGLTMNIPYSLDFDAAYRNTNAPWRMPTTTEFAELFSNIRYIDANGDEISGDNKLTTVNGVVGLYLESTVNGNRLFFACSGYGIGTPWYHPGSDGYYWSASFYSASRARSLCFDSGGVYPQHDDYRFVGFAVRPVRSKKQTLDLDWIRNEGVENFNIWDEEWEEGVWSLWQGGNGSKISIAGHIRSKYFIPCLSNTTYYAKGELVIGFYDANKNYLGSDFSAEGVDFTFISPSAASYMVFYTDQSTYNHDICINISNPALNGEYHPHGEKAKYFPFGLLSAGNVYDEVTETKAIKRVGVVDLGSLNWSNDSTYTANVYRMRSNGIRNYIRKNTSDERKPTWILESKYEILNPTQTYGYPTFVGNGISVEIAGDITVYDSNYNTQSSAADFKTAMQGVMLYYELETPVEIPLAEPHRMSYVVDDHGTEQQIPVSAYSPFNAPFAGTFEYYSNFKDAVLDLINRVNGYTNPVRGKNNSAQTEGKLAEYDSDSTVKSSLYAPSNATIVAGADGNEYILPSVAALVAYVQTLISSALHYKGTVASWAALPSSGQQTGDLYIFSAVDTTHTPPIGIGDFAIWNGSSWDLIQGTVSVTNSNPTLVLNGQTYTIGTVEGVSLTLVTPNLQMSDPIANGTANDLQVITNVSQTNGQTAATKKVIPSASVSQKGVVQLERDIHYSESPDKVPSAGQTWRELSKRNVKAVPIAVVPVPAVYNTDLFASYELEASSNPEFTVNNSTFAQVYAANMGGYLFYVNNGVVYAAKMKATNWTKFDDDTDITPAIRAATETMIHVPTCNYKASGKKMKFGGLNPLYGGDYFKSPRWVGAYQMDMNGHSRPGVGSGHSKTMTEFWNLAQAIHSDFGLANYEFHNLINALYQAMFGDLNSEYVLSDSNSRSSANWDKYRDLAHGAADSLADGAFVAAPHCVAVVDGAGVTRHVTKFCGFEDLFGKLWEFRPGIRFYMDNGVRKAVVYDGNIVSNSAQGRIISGVLASASGQFTTEMELGEHWDMLPKAVGGDWNQYYCDGAWASAYGELLIVGGPASAGSPCGVSYSASDGGFGNAYGSIGARLAFYSDPIILSGADFVAQMA